MNHDLKFFKNNLKKIRIKKNLTVKDLATKVNMAQPNVTNLENNKSLLSLPLIETFATALNCSPLEIVTDFDNNSLNDKDLIEQVTTLTQHIEHNDLIKYNKMIIKLYLALLNLKRKGIKIEKTTDSDVREIIETIIGGAYI
ncbi:helix-turn-helix domain-containing protein [Rickettsiales bacterium LUAb2]